MIAVGENRKQSFDRSLRYQRQKVYDIHEYETVPFIGNGDKREVYRNFNFSIFVDDECNADCKFCVAQLRYEHKGKLYEKDHIQDDKEYMARLREVLTKVRPLNPSISITGGEPTISTRLVPILRLVNELGFRKRTITTNGSQLLKKVEEKTILEHLTENGFDHLNISRVVIDDKKNAEIMRYQDSGCLNRELKKIAEMVSGKHLRIRMSCLLLKEGVSTVPQIKEYVDFYKEFGIDNFIFRQLMEYDHKAVNREKVAYCDSNKIDLNPIWEEMEKDPEIIPYLNLLGYYYYVECYDYHGCRIASESADLEQQYREKAKHPEMVYEMVFHTNGNLCGSWIPEEEILL